MEFKVENLDTNTIAQKINYNFSPGSKKTLHYDPDDIYLLKVNNRSTRARCEICSELTIKTPEGYKRRRSGVLIVNFEHISHFVLVFLL